MGSGKSPVLQALTDQEEHTIVAQWISTSQDSVFISEDMLYYGKIESSEYHPKLLAEMASIPLSYLRVLEIDSKKKTTTLEYYSSTLLIRWEKLDTMNEFKKFMIRRFPNSFTLFREDTVKFKTRGTIVALVIIPIIYVIALLTPTDKAHYSGKRFSEAIIALFQALSSMGVLALTILFGSLFLIALLRLFHERNKSTHITIIQLR